MKAFDIVSSKQYLLVESHFKRTNLLVENVCVDLTKEQKIVVEGIYREFRPLIEATLTPDQINKIFTDVEASATASGDNRTGIGKAKDVASAGIEKSKEVISAVNNIINKAGKWVQDTAPVKAFDQKFEKLKNDINTKFPDSKILDGISKLGMYAKENPGKTAAVIGVLTALASLAGGPIGGAIAGQVLRGSAELLKGEKLSTAIGKGVKTAALGYISGKAFEMLGNWMAGFREQSIPFGPEEAGLERVSWGATKTISGPGTEWTRTTQGFDALVRPEEADAIRSAMLGIKSGESGAFDSLLAVAREVNSKDYKSGLDEIVQGAWKAAKDNDSLLQFINSAKAGLSAGAQGVATAASAKESKDLSSKEINRIFEWCNGTPSTVIMEGPMDAIKGALSKAGKNLTTKVTADKLNKAWKAAGSPTDSDAVADVLRKGGVSDQVLAPLFKSMKIKLSPVANARQDSAPTQSSQPAGAEEILNFKALSAAVSQLRTRDAQSLLKYIDTLAPAAQTKPVKPAAVPAQPAATKAVPTKPAPVAPPQPNIKVAGKRAAAVPAKPKSVIAV
jgi:hypothetical protein